MTEFIKQNRINHDHYYFVDNLRALSCFLVVWHHTLGYLNTAPISVFYTEFIKKYTASVPVFLVISAFVYAKNIESRNTKYNVYIKKRVDRILIPYITISIITFLFQLFIEYTNIIPITKYSYTPFSSLNAFINISFSGVADHYYFLEIIFIYLITYPVVVKFFHKKWQALSLLFGYLALYEIIDPENIVFLSASNDVISDLILETLWGWKFFLFGFVLYKFKDFYMKKSFNNGLVYGSVLFIVYAILMMIFPSQYKYLSFILVSSYIVISIQFSRKSYKPIKIISNFSYGIFILHQPYFIKASIMISGVAFPSITPDIKVVTVWVLSCVTVTLFIYYMQRVRLFNRLLLGVTN